MKKGLTAAYCALCIVCLVISLILSCFSQLLTLNIGDIGTKYSSALADTVSAVNSSRTDDTGDYQMYNSFVSKVVHVGADGSDGYSFGLSLFDIMRSLGTASRLTGFASRIAGSGMTDGIRADIADFRDEISWNDIDTAYLMLSVRSAFESGAPVYTAVTLAGFLCVICFMPLLLVALLFTLISSVIVAVSSGKNVIRLGRRLGKRINDAIFCLLVCIAAIPVMCGAEITKNFIVMIILLLSAVIVRCVIAHTDRDGGDIHTYLFLIQIASVFGLIGFIVFISGAADLNMNHRLIAGLDDAFRSSGAEASGRHAAWVAFWFVIFAVFTVLSALYPFYSVRRLGCQFTQRKKRIVTDSRISYAVVLALPIVAVSVIFGSMGYPLTNETTGNFITMVTGAVVMLASEAVVPVFRRIIHIGISRQDRSKYLCGDALDESGNRVSGGEKPRIKPSIKIVDVKKAQTEKGE